jgi:hypothetical protein
MPRSNYDTLCAEPRSLKPLCRHLKIEKGAVCKKGVELKQDVILLVPAHGQKCEHFVLLEEEPEEPAEQPKKRGRKKKASKDEAPTPAVEIAEDQD